MSGKDITVKAADGPFSAYLATAAGKPKGSVVVIQEIFGVNSHIRSVCDRLAAAGFNALAPDLFHRSEPGVQLGYGEADFGRGFELMKALDHGKALADIDACIADLRSHGGKVAVLGFCMGGLLSFRSAANLKPDAAVAYYGGGIANFLGEAGNITCPIQFHFGEKDHFIPRSDVDKVRAATASLKDSAVYVYPADHGFNCDQRASYDAAAAELAWQRSLDFLGRHLA
jgi:carboxymethylenebutenolidase